MKIYICLFYYFMTRKTVSSEIVYENPWIEVTHNIVITPNGTTWIYGKVHYKNRWVYVLVLNDKGEIWLVWQDRYPINEYTREIMSWWVLENEELIDWAKRELEEEMKVIPQSIERYMEIHQANSVTDDINNVYIAKYCIKKDDAKHDDTEKIDIMYVSIEEAYKMIQKWKIKEAATVAIISRFYLDSVLLWSE